MKSTPFLTMGVFLDEQSLTGGLLDLKAILDSLENWQLYAQTTPAEVLERCLDAQIIITNKVVLDRPIIAQLAALRLICVAATGTNNVDLTAANERNVVVCNVTDYAGPSLSQHVFALLLALVTRLPEYQLAIKQGKWQRSTQFCLLDYPIMELAGKTIGIVGYGQLGQAVARLAEAFNMRVLIAAHGALSAPNCVPLAELLPRVDVLSLHCPLTAISHNLIGAKELAVMKSGAILINTARGGLVDEAALAQALVDGHIGGAGVDVLSEEPPTAGNPLLDRAIPNLIVTPHVAWASVQSRQRMVNEIGRNIQAYLAGQPRNVVV